jgi:hypothetical protein
MRNRKIFKTDDKSYIFEDRDNPNSFYCMDYETLQQEIKIISEFENKEENVPDDSFIYVFPIHNTGEIDHFCDVYEISSNELIKFPINRINWIWLQIINY